MNAKGAVRLWPYFLIVAAIATMHGQVLFAEFAFRDDYSQLYRYQAGDSRFPANVLAEGRPVYWALIHLLYPSLHTIHDMVWLRGLNVLLMAGWGFLLHWWVRRSGFSTLRAVVFVVGLLAFPTYGVLAGWAGTFQIQVGALLGAGAGVLATRADHAKCIVSGLAAVAMLLLALATYQPSAMVCWLMPLIAYSRRDHLPVTLRVVAGYGAGFAAVLVAYYVLYRSGVQWLAAYDAFLQVKSGRGVLNSDPLFRLHWWLKEPLHDVLSLYWLTPQRALPLVAGMLVMLAAWRPAPQRINARIGWGALFVAAVGGASLTLFASAEMNGEYRVQLALAAVVWWLITQAVAERLPASVPRKFRACAGVCMVGYVMAMGHYNTRQFTLPQVSELQRARAALRPIADATTVVCYRTPEPGAMQKHEYGLVSSQFPWVIQGLLSLLTHERYGVWLAPEQPISLLTANSEGSGCQVVLEP